MSEAYRQARKLAAGSAYLEAALGEFEAAHAGIFAELPASAFSALGKGFAGHFSDLAPCERSLILSGVEQLIRHPLALVRDCVATGFLEALASAVDTGVLSFADFAAELGAESTVYWKAWNAFGGILDTEH